MPDQDSELKQMMEELSEAMKTIMPNFQALLVKQEQNRPEFLHHVEPVKRGAVMVADWKHVPSSRHIKIGAMTVRSGYNGELRAILGWVVHMPNKGRKEFPDWENAIAYANKQIQLWKRQREEAMKCS